MGAFFFAKFNAELQKTQLKHHCTRTRRNTNIIMMKYLAVNTAQYIPRKSISPSTFLLQQ